MTRIEIMRCNKQAYADFSAKIAGMRGIQKAVAENLTLEWIKGNNWLGGLSDSRYQKISDKLISAGYDEMEIYDEFDNQISKF